MDWWKLHLHMHILALCTQDKLVFRFKSRKPQTIHQVLIQSHLIFIFEHIRKKRDLVVWYDSDFQRLAGKCEVDEPNIWECRVLL